MNNLRGTGVAMVTPFRKDGGVDFRALTALTEHLVKGKVEYLVVLGTTGESVTLSKDEKQAVLNCVMEANDGRLPVVLGVGGNNTAEICKELNNLDTTGLKAILSVSPYYNKPTQRGIYEHYRTVAGASPLPIILYNVPGRTGSNVLAETTLQLANEVPNIVAVKEASGNMEQVMRIIRDRPKGFLVISGDDALTMPMIATGADGVISVIANAFAKEFSNMVRASLAGELDKARKGHYQLFDAMQAIFAEGNPGGIKAILNHMNLCENKLRLPLVPVSRALQTRLQELTTKING
jgi:4-hydroxy-tetrahydrodipicolinate synthase